MKKESLERDEGYKGISDPQRRVSVQGVVTIHLCQCMEEQMNDDLANVVLYLQKKE